MTFIAFSARPYRAEYPIVSIEDPFDQDDWDNTATLTSAGVCQVWAVQVDPGLEAVDPTLAFRDFQCLKLKRDKLLSNVALNCKLRHYSQVVGDDLLVTNPERVATAIEVGRCNCSLTPGFRR